MTATIAQAIGVRESGRQSVMEAVAEHLQDREMLLVLDNFEQVLSAAGEVDRLLKRSPGLKVLVTSRAPLHLSWEHEVAIGPLAVPQGGELLQPSVLATNPSVQLFMERATAVRSEFELDEANARTIGELCIRLDGLPLAIELAAARIKLLTPAAIAERMDKRLTLLVGGARDRPARHQTLVAAIDWSYGLLDEREQILFRQLAVFEGSWTLVDVSAVCGQAADQTEDDLLDGPGSLLDKSLIYAQRTRRLNLATRCSKA